jgi:hypothetical protein
MTNFKITIKYALITLIAVLFTFIFHEFTHWLTGELLGYKMTMRLNYASLTGKGVYKEFWEENLVSASGPIFTIIQGIIFYLIMEKYKNINFYPFLFLPFFMRLLAFTMSFNLPNDEARISRNLGIGTYTLFIIVCLFLGVLVYKTSKKYLIDFKFQMSNIVLTIVFIALIVLGDNFLKINLIN